MPYPALEDFPCAWFSTVLQLLLAVCDMQGVSNFETRCAPNRRINGLRLVHSLRINYLFIIANYRVTVKVWIFVTGFKQEIFHPHFGDNVSKTKKRNGFRVLVFGKQKNFLS